MQPLLTLSELLNIAPPMKRGSVLPSTAFAFSHTRVPEVYAMLIEYLWINEGSQSADVRGSKPYVIRALGGYGVVLLRVVQPYGNNIFG
mgnify:CR=1 FL=1